MKPLKDGLLPFLLFVLITLNGCAPLPPQVPVAVECPPLPQLDRRLLDPTPTQYLLPSELRRTAPKQP